MKETAKKKDKQLVREKAYEILHLLSDPHRMRILRTLSENGELCAKDILVHFPITQPTLSHHMSVLQKTGLVAAKKCGRQVFYRISPEGLDLLIQFFSEIREEGLRTDVISATDSPRSIAKPSPVPSTETEKVNEDPEVASELPHTKKKTKAEKEHKKKKKDKKKKK